MTLPSDIPEDIADRAAILMDEYRHIEDDLEFTARIIMALEQEHLQKLHHGLTSSQSRALTFIDGFLEGQGHCPSYQEIQDAMGLRSKSGAHRLVQGLIARGALVKLPGRVRSLAVARFNPISKTNVSTAYKNSEVA